jgi:hypothetical protein
MLDDNKKIGIGMMCLGFAFVFLGIVLFFDSSLIAIGNVLFLMGVVFCIGLKGTLAIFTRRDRIRGTICLALGIFLVLMKWGLFGIVLEGFGFLNLFGNFLPVALNLARQVPFLSVILELPGISQTADFIAGKTRPKYSV